MRQGKTISELQKLENELAKYKADRDDCCRYLAAAMQNDNAEGIDKCNRVIDLLDEQIKETEKAIFMAEQLSINVSEMIPLLLTVKDGNLHVLKTKS